MIFVDGVYVTEVSGAPVFRAARSPCAGELQALVQRLGELIGHCIRWRIAVGQRAKLERLCRYVSRAPLDLSARLASLVPPRAAACVR